MEVPIPRSPRVGLLVPSASKAAGGVFEALLGQCEMLRSVGFETLVIARGKTLSAEDRARFGDTEVRLVPPSTLKLGGFAPGMLKTLLDCQLDLLHLHGIWMYPSLAGSQWRKRTGKPYIISPHGMLDPWIVSRGKLKKGVAQIAYERRSWKLATCFHALTTDEAADIKVITKRDDSVVIPNAISLASREGIQDTTVTYLGRIHPKKNIDALILGWRAAAPILQPLGARLLIAGWGDSEHVAEIRNLVDQGGTGDVEFIGPVYGSRKAELISSSRFLALPSKSEGLPMVVLEAWAAGIPTIMSQHCHLPEGFEYGAAINSGTTPVMIAAALAQAFNQTQEQWTEMSKAALNLVEERFLSSVVATKWQNFYNSLLKNDAID